MQKNTLLKKIIPMTFIAISFLLFNILSLKSTSFNHIQTPNKIIISMNPVYSAGDPVSVPMPVPVTVSLSQPINTQKNNLDQAQPTETKNLYSHYPQIKNPRIMMPMTPKYHQQNILNHRIATDAPTSIIPYYTSEQTRNVINHISYNKNIATQSPTSIIPDYIPQRQIFNRSYVETVNSYIKPKKISDNPHQGAFQTKIPNGNSIKQFRPVAKLPVVTYGKTSYTLPVYQEYASIRK